MVVTADGGGVQRPGAGVVGLYVAAAIATIPILGITVIAKFRVAYVPVSVDRLAGVSNSDVAIAERTYTLFTRQLKVGVCVALCTHRQTGA